MTNSVKVLSSHLLSNDPAISRTHAHKCVGPSWRPPKSTLKIRGCSRRSPMPFKFAVKKSYNHDLIVTPLIAKKPKMQCQQKCEETKSIHKRMMSEKKVESNNFDNAELQVHSHDQAEYCTKLVTWNCANGTNVM